MSQLPHLELLQNQARPTIAFIDDEERVLRSLKMHFRQSHNVYATTNPDDLLEFVKHHDVQVVVSDQRMPQMLGVDVLSKVKAISPNTIRILLTGYADLNAVIDSVNEGEIYRYITKPWQNDELKTIINKATDIAQKTQHINLRESVAQSKETKRVLVLDDDEDTYRLIKGQFEPMYQVSWANSLDRAATLLSKHRYGVVVSDVTLAGEDIAPVVYALKNLQPDLMVLMLSEYKDAHLIIDLINKGQIFRCLPRPTNVSMLQISVERAYQHHEKLLQQPELTQRHHVEKSEEVAQHPFAKKLKALLSKLNFWQGWRSSFST